MYRLYSSRLRASRRGCVVTLAAAAVLLPSATSAWGQSLVGDQAVGYVSAQANGLNGSNLFYPVVGVIGSGVEFSGYHGNEGERISYFEADFDANSFTIRMENVHFQNRSVHAVPTNWHFTDLNWLPDAQKIVGITKTPIPSRPAPATPSSPPTTRAPAQSPSDSRTTARR